MTICPCCGQPVNAGRAPIEALDAAPLATVPRAIVNALVKAYPRALSADALISAVYSGAREPEYARGAISVQLNRIRDKLALYGWTVSRGAGGRGNTSMHRLEPLQ